MNVVRILVVDDERVIADTLARILDSAGYECTVAYDGVDGVEKLACFGPSSS
jgi:DNA-binding response OmpR family regulator